MRERIGPNSTTVWRDAFVVPGMWSADKRRKDTASRSIRYV